LANDIELRIDGDTAGFKSQSNQIGLSKSRNRHFSFDDHFSQAAFWNSQSVLKKHIVAAFKFELSKSRVVLFIKGGSTTLPMLI
jgi:catalase